MQNRKIAFRAWDRKNKKWVTDVDLSNSNVMTIRQTKDGFRFLNEKESDFDFVQFTGLLDSKGREIYEGDFVRNPSNVIWWIEWQEDKGRWTYRCGGIAEQPYGKTYFGLTYSSAIKMEILGNRFSNPELLNK